MDEPRPKRVLIGCVGRKEPDSERGERPIATAVRALHPDRVDLIYSPTTKEAYEKLHRYLWSEFGIEDRRQWFLNIDNPTRYGLFIEPLINILEGIKSSLASEDVEFHIVDSGAPQLRMVLLLSVLSRLIEATVWHVDDPHEESPIGKREQAWKRLAQVDLSLFEGAAIRFYRNIRLHLQVITSDQGHQEIHCEVVPGHWLKRDPQAGPLRLLLELCKARRGEAYGVKRIGGWVQTRLLQDRYERNAAPRAIARRSINNEVGGLDLGELSIDELIEARGSTRNREYRVKLEPEEILIEYKRVPETAG